MYASKNAGHLIFIASTEQIPGKLWFRFGSKLRALSLEASTSRAHLKNSHLNLKCLNLMCKLVPFPRPLLCSAALSFVDRQDYLKRQCSRTLASPRLPRFPAATTSNNAPVFSCQGLTSFLIHTTMRLGDGETICVCALLDECRVSFK